VSRWWIVAVVVSVVSLVAEIAARGSLHALFWWHLVPGFDLLYGLLGCVAIVLVSKAAGAWFLQRPEDYYSKDRE
jgi:hypothetical protein